MIRTGQIPSNRIFFSPVSPSSKEVSREAGRPVLRFGSDSNENLKLTPDQMRQFAAQMHDALDASVIHSDTGLLRELLSIMYKGKADLIERVRGASNVIEAELPKERDVRFVYDERDNIAGVYVKSGTYEKTFHNRRNIFSAEKDNGLTFSDYLELPQVFGDKKRVIIVIRGYTKPQPNYLEQQNEQAKDEMKGKPPGEKLLQAESFYVERTKEFLTLVLNELKSHGYSADDIGFVYGVTPLGVDRAIEEFSQKNNVKCAGITCYDWLSAVQRILPISHPCIL